MQRRYATTSITLDGKHYNRGDIVPETVNDKATLMQKTKTRRELEAEEEEKKNPPSTFDTPADLETESNAPELELLQGNDLPPVDPALIVNKKDNKNKVKKPEETVVVTPEEEIKKEADIPPKDPAESIPDAGLSTETFTKPEEGASLTPAEEDGPGASKPAAEQHMPAERTPRRRRGSTEEPPLPDLHKE